MNFRYINKLSCHRINIRYIDNSIPLMIRLDIDFFINSANFTPRIGAKVSFFLFQNKFYS
jgi:hypothetical protein